MTHVNILMFIVAYPPACKIVKIKSSSLLAFCLLSPFTLLTAKEAPIVIPSNEEILLDENFNDNDRIWSNVAIVNGEKTAESGNTEISGGIWKPLVEANGKGVTSFADTSFDLGDGSVSVYFDVAVGADRSGPASRFGIQLDETDVGRRLVCHIYPGGTGIVQYQSEGGTKDFRTASSSGIVSNGVFTTYKFTVSAPNGFGAMGTAETFYYDPVSASYISLGAVEKVDLGDGIFDRLNIFSRNGGGGDTAAKFNRVVVTQAPNS